MVHAQHRILVEVRLRRRATLNRDFLKPRRADAIEHRALHLRLGAAQVDDGAGINGSGELLDLEFARLTHGDIGDDRDVRVVRKTNGESLPLAAWTLLSPVCLLRSKLQHGDHLVRVKPWAGRHGGQHVERKREWLLPRGVGEFVHETLRGPHVAVVTRRTPKSGGTAPAQFAGPYLRPLNRIERETTGRHVARPAQHFDKRVVQRHHGAFAIESGREEVPPVGAIVVVRKILFARPRQFDRRARKFLGNRRRFNRKFVAAASAKSATQSGDVHLYIFRRETQPLYYEALAR